MNNATLWANLIEGRLARNYREAANTLIAAGVSDEDAEKAAYEGLCHLHYRLLRERMKASEEGRFATPPGV